MKNLTILIGAVIAAATSTTYGAIVYWGSQNLVLALDPMSRMDSGFIQIGDMAGDWDDFRVEMWLDMGMPSTMDMAMGAGLGIFAPGSMASGMNMDLGMGMNLGMGTAGVLGLALFSPNLAMGATIGPESPFLDSAYLCGSGGFGEDGGYIGLRTAMGQYGWVHVQTLSNSGTDTRRLLIDEWAHQLQPGLAIAAGEGGSGDWAPGRPYKMHWPQLPDLAATGMDVDLSSVTLADDFKCTATGPIEDIHLWGSFRGDVLPPEGEDGVYFTLSIYSDIPAANNGWSRPGNLLWSKVFNSGQYAVRKVYDGPEGWYDPTANRYLPNNHRQAYQYNFRIDQYPFIQQEGTIYWLAVRCYTSSTNSSFGWKTTSLERRWNDDAVYSAAGAAGWMEMTYPEQHRYKGLSIDMAFVITGEDETPSERDLGDAPDSSNSVAGATMLAYPTGVNAYFPTVYQAGSPPYGPVHLKPRDMFYLGKAVSLETEADIGTDEDAVNNIDPLNDASNQDRFDDGLVLPVVMPACQLTTVKYVVTVVNAPISPVYVNIWCDWNRDGDWDDVLTCDAGVHVTEWAVQNQTPALPGPGTYEIESPAFLCWHPTGRDFDPLWVRITIAEQQRLPSIVLVNAAPGFEGAGPAEGYLYGETEDYCIQPAIQAFPLKYDWGDAPTTATTGGYPTLAVQDGARHRPVGSWLGDKENMPDSEVDGQPQADALGDDTVGNPDEQGVVFSPLVIGRLASATVEVNGGGGMLQAWIDFNGDRSWQVSELIYNDFLPDGTHVLPFVVPDSAVAGETFARFRISATGGLYPAGPASNGEVEDHKVQIDKPSTGTSDKTWCQSPDLTPRGIDICVDGSNNASRTLADDFQCTSRGRLNLIRLWGSWKHDAKGEIKRIHVEIHPDDPIGSEGADRKNEYSKPGPEVLWQRTFSSGEFDEKAYHVMEIGYEWWWDPWTGELTPEGDKQVWLVEMSVKPEDGFLQEGSTDKPRIYWLSIAVETSEGQFGWKTRQWPEHFMDDAVCSGGSTTQNAWDELRYPTGHPFADIKENSVDLAFCLRFTLENPPVATSQPVAMTQCPPTETTCPALLTTCPVSQTCCPTTATKCPAYDTRCPTVETKCPVSSTKCPPTATQCQAVETQCSAVDTKCPATDTKCPAVSTKCPTYDTRCPTTDTKCPTVSTKCPTVDTKCPTTDTKCPATDTKCPAVSTKCPVVSTQCPATPTRCVIVKTQCSQCAVGMDWGSGLEAFLAAACPAIDVPCPLVADCDE